MDDGFLPSGIAVWFDFLFGWGFAVSALVLVHTPARLPARDGVYLY